MRAGHADRGASSRRSATSASRASASASRTSTTSILELNGRAHRSPEIFRAYEHARALGFPQINIDLIAGMLGETDENWQRCVEKTLALQPDSVTIYQMELPFNTTISSDLLKKTGRFTEPVANWATKRRWVRGGVRGARGGRLSRRAAPTPRPRIRRGRASSTRDRLWQGADMVGLGVASFGHINGVHMQNLDTWETYSAADRARRASRSAAPTGRPTRSG